MDCRVKRVHARFTARYARQRRGEAGGRSPPSSDLTRPLRQLRYQLLEVGLRPNASGAGTHVSLRADRKREFGDVVAVGRVENDQEIAVARGQIHLFDVNSDFLREFLRGFGALGGLLDRTDSLLGPVEQAHEHRHAVLREVEPVAPHAHFTRLRSSPRGAAASAIRVSTAAQSARMFASWTTLLHFAISALMRAPNASGVLATGAKPNACKRSFTSGAATAFAISSRQRSITSFGVSAGATMPVSVSLSRSGTPASALVGTSRNAAARLTLSTARPRNFPSLILVIAGGSAVKAIGVCPPMVELTASAALLNGTVTRSSWYCCLNSSPARCGVEPVEGCAKLYLPGCAFTSSMSSLSVVAGKLGWTEMTLGEAATNVIGAKSLTGS